MIKIKKFIKSFNEQIYDKYIFLGKYHFSGKDQIILNKYLDNIFLEYNLSTDNKMYKTNLAIFCNMNKIKEFYLNYLTTFIGVPKLIIMDENSFKTENLVALKIIEYLESEKLENKLIFDSYLYKKKFIDFLGNFKFLNKDEFVKWYCKKGYLHFCTKIDIDINSQYDLKKAIKLSLKTTKPSNISKKKNLVNVISDECDEIIKDSLNF